MPTGYTAPIASGEIKTFKEFALLCVRAMGVAYSMRDEPLSAPLPEKFTPRPFYKKWLDERTEELRAWEDASEEQRREMYEAERDEIKKSRREFIEDVKKENAAYASMLAEVQAWEPPTADHRKFQEFMVEQLKISMRSSEYYRDIPGSFEEWCEQKGSALQDRRMQALSDYEIELKRVEQQNRWLNDLLASLPE